MAQKWYQKATVQSAIVGAAALIIVGLTPIALQVPKLKGDIRNLERNVTEKTAEVQRLETLLAPFRTIALERYTGPEVEALKKLATQIQELQELDTEKTKRITVLESELARTSELAKPPTLELLPVVIVKNSTDLIATLRFKPSKNQPLGTLMFIAELPNKSNSSINDFWPTGGGGAFQSGKDSKFIAEDGQSARLVYSLMGAGYPTMELKLTAPSSVRIRGNFIDEPIITEIK